VTAARDHLSLLRAVATEARRDLDRLLRLPQERWRERVARARTRMRSRTFAELLLDESRARVRNEPNTAAVLAELVPLAMTWAETRTDLPWVASLLARAIVHRANALRVAGDLLGADRLFRALPALPPSDHLAAGEIFSLEASLRIGQRRFADAGRCLDESIDAYEQANHSVGVARALIKRANLAQALCQPEEIVPLLDRAASMLGDVADPYLLATTVTGRVNALCDLDRADEAERLLAEHSALYVQEGEAFTIAAYAFLAGRVALGVGRLDDAEMHLADARDRLLGLERDYDAIIAALYLADVLLAAGKAAELKRLATKLVLLFRTRGVARETLAALRLLAEAAQAEGVTAAVLAEVRSKLRETPVPVSGT
jgi:tetratricopeptide (TPR) repeat protein